MKAWLLSRHLESDYPRATMMTPATIALVLTLLGTAPLLETNEPVETNGPDEWLTLDRELALLAEAAAPEGSGPTLGGFLKFAYRRSDDVVVNGNDLGGFRFKNIRLTVADQIGDVAIYVEVFASTDNLNAGVKDAFARWPLHGDSIHAQAGRFKPPFVASSSIYEPRNVFYRRGEQGFTWAARGQGAQVDGVHGPLHWYLSALNGGDGAGDDNLFVAKATYALVGEDLVFDGQLGGFGPDNDLRLTLGASVADEGAISDGMVAAFEVLSVYRSFFFHAEILDYDDGFGVGAIPTGSSVRANGKGDTTPYDMTAQWMPSADWSAQVRWEDQDDVNDTSALWAGVTRYLEGTSARADLHFVSNESDLGDADILLAGLTLIF